MLFADLDAQGWVLIITAIGLGAGQLLQMYLSYKKGQKIDSLGNTIHKVNGDVESVKADVVTVKNLTNGITTRMVQAELIAERIVLKAEQAAKDLIQEAAKIAAAKVNQ